MSKRVVSGIVVLKLLLVGVLASTILFSLCLRVEAQVEEWVPYVPDSSQVEIDYWKEKGISCIDVSIELPSSGYNVSDWGTPSIVGNIISVNAEIWDWTGVDSQVITTKSHTYNLGNLSPGKYFFTFKAWGFLVKTTTFIVIPIPVGGYSFSIEEYTTEKPSTIYLLLLPILTAVFAVIKSKTPKKTGRHRCVCTIFTLMMLSSLSSLSVRFQTSKAGDVQITDFYSCDALGIPQDYFPIKTTAYFNISVRNLAQDPKSISIYISVHDELDVPIGIDQLDTTIPQNVSTYYIMSVFLPKWAYVGFATAYASLWEEGIPDGGKSTEFYIGPQDLMPPIIHILSPENATYETEPLSLVFTINERTTWIGYSLNGLKNVTVSGNTTLAGLDNGSYRIKVYANDTSGNVGSSKEIYLTILIVHDVAIIDLKCSSKEVCVGQVLNITVTVLNEGTMTETFNVFTYANSTAIEALTVTNLSRNNQENLVFVWNTTNVEQGNYTIKAVASTVARETDTADNTYIDGDVKITKPPVACFTFSPTVPFSWETITFDASLSTPDGGIIISYDWNFGDETPNATGMITTHAYADNGTYTVTLAVTDSGRLTDTDCRNMTVLNRPPVANFSETAETVYVDELINFNASTSYDPDGTIAAYFWDFGDGTNATGITVVHGYEHNGTYKITMAVTDDDSVSASTSTIKNVLNRPDIAVSNVTSSKTVLGQEYSLEINVTVTNKGDSVETFGVTIYAGATSIATQTVTLTSGNFTTITFTWNTTDFAKGNYTVWAYAWHVTGEAYTSDNILADGWVFVTIPGDANGDKKVNMLDCILVANHFNHADGDGHTPGSKVWFDCMNCDINSDLKVNVLDCIILSNNFGKTTP